MMRCSTRKAAAALAVSFAAATAASNVSPAQADPLPYGPDTCKPGLVWREARPGDTVCVTPEVRTTTGEENANPAANKQPGGGAHGPETCNPGFVWREAFDGDTICVSPNERSDTLAANAAANSNKAANAPSGCFTSSAGYLGPRSIFATFDSCGGGVYLQLPPCPGYDPAPPLCSVDHYNIGFGQRQGSVNDVREPVFSGQRERDGDKSHYLFGTRSKPGPVAAFFRFQGCGRGPFGNSDCDAWSDPVGIDLGNNELVAR